VVSPSIVTDDFFDFLLTFRQERLVTLFTWLHCAARQKITTHIVVAVVNNDLSAPVTMQVRKQW